MCYEQSHKSLSFSGVKGWSTFCWKNLCVSKGWVELCLNCKHLSACCNQPLHCWRPSLRQIWQPKWLPFIVVVRFLSQAKERHSQWSSYQEVKRQWWPWHSSSQSSAATLLHFTCLMKSMLHLTHNTEQQLEVSFSGLLIWLVLVWLCQGWSKLFAAFPNSCSFSLIGSLSIAQCGLVSDHDILIWHLWRQMCHCVSCHCWRTQ